MLVVILFSLLIPQEVNFIYFIFSLTIIPFTITIFALFSIINQIFIILSHFSFKFNF